MKIIKKIGIGLLCLVLFSLLAFNLYNFVSIHLLHQELPSFFGYSVLEVVSGSMEPSIHVGDLIVINRNASHYQKGDIVTFKDVDGSFVTHRIEKIDDDQMVTKGDANDSSDDAMPRSSLRGKYLFRLNGMGRLLASFRNPFVIGMIFIIGVIVCIFLSIDKDGNPILDPEEEAFYEFKEQKKKQESASLKAEPAYSDFPDFTENTMIIPRSTFARGELLLEKNKDPYLKKRYLQLKNDYKRVEEIYLQIKKVYLEVKNRYAQTKITYLSSKEVYLYQKEVYELHKTSKNLYMKAYHDCIRAKNAYIGAYKKLSRIQDAYKKQRRVYLFTKNAYLKVQKEVELLEEIEELERL